MRISPSLLVLAGGLTGNPGLDPPQGLELRHPAPSPARFSLADFDSAKGADYFLYNPNLDVLEIEDSDIVGTERATWTRGVVRVR